MEEIILIRYGEIMLKGLNRSYFENKLVSNIKNTLNKLGKTKIIRSHGRIFIESQDEAFDREKAIGRLEKVFGIVSISPVLRIANNFENIKKHSLHIAKQQIEEGAGTTFKIETKRSNKKFHMNTPEINSELGAYLLSELPALKVDVNNPSFTVHVEIRDFTYLFTKIYPSFGGLPVGSSGKAMLLLSGGIDSPVAGWMMAKRGVEIEAIHFYSYPYTSERSKEKVIELAKELSSYCLNINLHIVPFTDIQLEIANKCPKDQLTIIMRRVMMSIAKKIAESTRCNALITGESLGQVASQTIQSLSVTNASIDMPIFRPLIGMDKNEIIEIAKKINTYETSILPYEDCCTVFVAKHPETKPKLKNILLSESNLDLNKLIEKASGNVETISI
jgi:thiamine biosynthesis protein ThiI